MLGEEGFGFGIWICSAVDLGMSSNKASTTARYLPCTYVQLAFLAKEMEGMEDDGSVGHSGTTASKGCQKFANRQLPEKPKLCGFCSRHEVG